MAIYRCTATHTIVSGTSLYTLVQVGGGALPAPVDGDQYRIVFPITNATGLANVIVPTDHQINIVGPDLSSIYFYELKPGAPIWFDYLASLDVLVRTSAPESWTQSGILHGSVALAGGAIDEADDGTLHVSQGMMGTRPGMILQAPDGSFRKCQPSQLTQNLFNGTATVAGVANQSLIAGYHYIFAKNLSANPADVGLNFCRVAVGSPTVNYPTLSEVGTWVMHTSGGIDRAWTHIGGLVVVNSTAGLHARGTHLNIGFSPYNPLQNPVSTWGDPWNFPIQNQRTDSAVQGTDFETISTDWVDTGVTVTCAVNAVTNLPTLTSKARFQCARLDAVGWHRLRIEAYGISNGTMVLQELFSMESSGPSGSTIVTDFGGGLADGYVVIHPQVKVVYSARTRSSLVPKLATFRIGELCSIWL